MFVLVDDLWYLECKQINRDLFSQCTKSAAPETLASVYTQTNICCKKHKIYNTIQLDIIMQLKLLL